MSVRVKHINDDATYLITFSIPEDSNIPYEQLKEFTVLTDPWISGSWHMLHSKFVFGKITGQCCIESLAQLDPAPNVVIVSQDKPDHCHEKSLKQLNADLPGTTIYAQAGAAKRIKSWKYFPSHKVVPLSIYEAGTSETSLVRYSIPAQEEMHRYPGIIPGELTMAFLAPKLDIAGVHSGVGFTYRPPMFVDPKTGFSSSVMSLVPIRSAGSNTHSRSASINSKLTTTRLTEFNFDFGLKEVAVAAEKFQVPIPSPRNKRLGSLSQLDVSRSGYFDNCLPTPPDSPTRSTTTIETRTTATEYSTNEPYHCDLSPAQLAPEWLLPPTPTLHPAKTRSMSAGSLVHRLKSAVSTPDLHASRPTTPLKKPFNLRKDKRFPSSQALTITSPRRPYTTDPDAPPLPNSPLSPCYPLTPTTTLPSTQRPKTPYTPTSTIAGPKTISILFVPHGIPYTALEPWITSHLVLTAALPLTLLLHPFDSVRNLWFLGGHVIQGGLQGAEIAKALMAKQWISTHDGAKEESGWLVKKVVKRVFTREEVSKILEDDIRGWDYRQVLDNQRPKTAVEVLKVGQDIVLSA